MLLFSSEGRDSPVVKVSDRGQRVMSSIPLPLKIRRVGKRCTLNIYLELKRPPVGVVWQLGEGGDSSSVVHATRPWFKITRSVAKSPSCSLTVRL
ncbi:hypothetical protein TNCV_3752781 [Trichonephila clavipes]|nr:hypothetical protein TNCV_3752781 [Trichonephila clavipes]